MPRIAIVGAGIAGATLARRLVDAGHEVVIFEKSRGTGGRLAAARLGESSVDLGAPILEAQSEAFATWLGAQQASGLVVPWNTQVGAFASSRQPEARSFWLGGGRNSALTRGLLAGATLHTETRVGVIWSDAQGVLLRDEQGEALGYFDSAVCAAPAPQAVPLLEAVPRFAQRARQAHTEASWVLLLELQQLPQRLEGLGMVVGDHPAMQRIIVESAKPGRTGSIVKLEMRADWSEARLDADRDVLLSEIQALFSDWCGEPVAVSHTRIHRWLYSRSVQPEPVQGALWDAHLAIGACGDWIAAQGVEGSWRSANLLADQILQSC